MRVVIYSCRDYFFFNDMKKYLLILLCFISISGYAQVQWYRTTQYAEATIINNRYYWGDWESSNMRLCIDIGNDQIIVYSPRIQIYQVYGVYNNGQPYVDDSGGTNIKFYVIDQDYDRGSIRLRVEKNGNSQIYIDFSNVAWVYNVVRTQ